MKTVLVIDIGTSSMRGILLDKKGTFIYKKKIDYQPEYFKDGGAVQDANIFFECCLKICSDCSNYSRKSNNDIVAISITSQRSSLIPTKNGKPMCKAIMWQDTRVSELIKRYESYDKFIVEKTGSKINAVYLGAKIVWLQKNNPKVYSLSDKMLNVPSFLIHGMTGNYVMDTTYGSRTNLMNIRTKHWEKDLFKILDIDINKMPDIIEPGSICGNITKKYAMKSGLPVGIPVISAGGDQQCAAIGEGLLNDNTISVNTGTGGYIIKSIDKLPADINENIIYNCSAIAGKYILEVDLLACSSVLSWFVKNFYDPNNKGFDEINGDIESCYNKAISVTTLPYFKGKTVGGSDNKIRAAFTNIGLSTTKADILYSLMTSLFIEIGNAIDILKSFGPITSIIIGGGLTSSKIMNQMQSDVYNFKIQRSPNAEPTAMGALLSALVAIKLYSSFDDAYENIGSDKGEYFEPNINNVCLQSDFITRKNNLYDVLKRIRIGIYDSKSKDSIK